MTENITQTKSITPITIMSLGLGVTLLFIMDGHSIDSFFSSDEKGFSETVKNIRKVEKALGKTAEKEFLPLQPGDVPDTYADSKNLVDQLYYKPSTSVEEGITKFISWYHDYNKP